MKKIKWFSAMIALTVVLGGCASNANQQPVASGSGEATKPAPTLTVAYSEGGTTMDPAEANDLTSDTLVLAIYDQLVTYGVKTVDGADVANTEDIQPMLAESWEVSDDNTTYTFKIKSGLKFQSGNPVNADAVVYSFDRVAKSSSGSFLYGMADIKSVTAKDDSTVEIVLNKANHMFTQIIAMYTFSIVDQKLVEEKGDDYLKTNAAGSGPFTLEKWDPASEAVFQANNEYWQGAPKLSKVTLKFTKEASNRVLLLNKSDVDMAIEIPPKDVAALQENSNLTIKSNASNRILFFAMNNNVKPFDNEKVRQAINYAIPYDQLINDVMYGQAKEMKSAVASNTPGYTDAGYVYEYNLDKAKELLKEAGYAEGFSFDFTLGSGFDDWEYDAVLIQAELAKIGVKMNINKVARAQFLEQQKDGNLVSYISKWTSFVNDPGYHLGFLLYGEGSSNYIHYNNSEVNKLWEEAGAEPDQAKRNELYMKAQEIITTEAPWAYLYEYNRVVGMNNKVSGYVYYPDEVLRFYPLSKEQ
ncbi:ABC transporter substrate-binding protein [Paenibacillus xylanivorans]|uniref:Peptide ABC transporter substrate-binding protein n=1 Tax=Paenibacillus xylanivorans TaxID=1705561 RepID=A0A0M9BRI8_9BACL|nr:ABC transporter substrate-binding protein [Paenibacillus xylanivorans]KOY17608.1 peptide ABC transporter substrate-binding protein [Paenibacillus xylanivorans]